MYSPPVPWETLRGATTDVVAHLWLQSLARDGGRNLIPHSLFLGAKAARDEAGAPDDADALLNRLSDAWAWLVAHGYVGPEPARVNEGYVRITDAGREFADDDGAVARVWAEDRLQGGLDSRLQVAQANLAMGQYETAAFAAMKAVEVAVRDASGLSDGVIGVPLMRLAFAPKAPGPLADVSAEGGEQQATMDLFAGAIGVFKNPASHRNVSFDDPTEVAEVIQLADLLLRIVERRAPSA